MTPKGSFSLVAGPGIEPGPGGYEPPEVPLLHPAVYSAIVRLFLSDFKYFSFFIASDRFSYILNRNNVHGWPLLVKRAFGPLCSFIRRERLFV